MRILAGSRLLSPAQRRCPPAQEAMPEQRLRSCIKRGLLAFGLMGPIAFNVAPKSFEALSINSFRPQIHSVVVDMPRVISLPPASGEAWETWWANVPSVDHLDDQRLTTDQVAQNSDRLAAAIGDL